MLLVSGSWRWFATTTGTIRGYEAQRVGEASHPGPSAISFEAWTQFDLEESGIITGVRASPGRSVAHRQGLMSHRLSGGCVPSNRYMDIAGVIGFEAWSQFDLEESDVIGFRVWSQFDFKGRGLWWWFATNAGTIRGYEAQRVGEANNPGPSGGEDMQEVLAVGSAPNSAERASSDGDGSRFTEEGRAGTQWTDSPEPTDTQWTLPNRLQHDSLAGAAPSLRRSDLLSRRLVRKTTISEVVFAPGPAASAASSTDSFIWDCPVCLQRVFAASSPQLSSRRDNHVAARHPLHARETIPWRGSTPVTPSATPLIPPTEAAWECPLCHDRLPTLGAHMRILAVRKHVRERHPGYTPQMLKSLRIRSRLGYFADHAERMRNIMAPKQRAYLLERMAAGHEAVYIQGDMRRPAYVGKTRQTMNGYYLGKHGWKKQTGRIRDTPCPGPGRATSPQITWWSLHRAADTAVPVAFAQAMEVSLTAADKYFCYFPRESHLKHEMVNFTVKRKYQELTGGRAPTGKWSICRGCRHYVCVRFRERPCPGLQSPTGKKMSCWRRHRRWGSRYVAALGRALGLTTQELDQWYHSS